MIPLDFATKIPWEEIGLTAKPQPALLALRHAIAFRLPGLWTDSKIAPRSLMLVRDGDGINMEVFAAGRPEAAVGWLAKQNRPFSLIASEPWFVEVVKKLGKGQIGTVETWVDSDSSDDVRPPNKRIQVRPLGPKDAQGFAATAPSWALRGWRSFDALLENGAAFGVPLAQKPGFASIAWVFDRADPFASIGVFTAERFRNLGLGRAVAVNLIDHIRSETELAPLWSTDSNHPASLSLALTLGFQPAVEEAILRWPPVA